MNFLNSSKINSKFLTTTILIIFLIIMTAQGVVADKKSCNDAGSIWCGPEAGGSCDIPPSDVAPLQPGTKSCKILVNQTVITTHNSHYLFNELLIEDKTFLRFVSKDACTAPEKNYFGGAGGFRGTYDTSEDYGKGTPLGGLGGRGGQTCAFGVSGFSGSGCGAAGGGSVADFVGAIVHIYTNKINLKGKLSVDGDAGSGGKNASGTCDDDCWGIACSNSVGKAGGGGAGGNGAGIIYLKSQLFEGTGIISAIGGAGGAGGGFSDEEGTSCGWANNGEDRGSAGGAGGGAGGGYVVLSGTFSPTANINIQNSGGVGGLSGCASTSAPGGVGTQGKPETSQGGEYLSEKDCNDGLDDDKDLFIDMNDPDCYETFALKFFWDNSAWKILTPKPTTYNPSALNGADLICGDDIVGECFANNPDKDSISVDCSTYNNDLQTCKDVGCTPISFLNKFEAINCNDITDRTNCEYQKGCFVTEDPSQCDYVAGKWECHGADTFLSCDGPVKSCSQEPNNLGCKPGEQPLPCNYFNNEELCRRQEGCSWNEGVCEGNPNNCLLSPTNFGCTQEYCEGNTFEIKCTDMDETGCRTFTDTCSWKPKDNQPASIPEYILSNTTGDLGYIADDGIFAEYLCLDNSATGEQESVTVPGDKFVWRSAAPGNNKDFWIMQSGNTHYISNNAEWFYCDAFNVTPTEDQNISRYKTFNPEFPNGEVRCSNEITPIVKAAEDKAGNFEAVYSTTDCKSTDPNVCISDMPDQAGDVKAVYSFCVASNSDGRPTTFNPTVGYDDTGGFKSSCYSNCRVWESSSETYVPFGNYLASRTFDQENVCENMDSSIAACDPSIWSTSGLPGESCSILEVFMGDCDAFKAINTANTCEAIIKDDLGYPRYDEDARLCNQDPAIMQYCEGGTLVKSSDSSKASCCVGLDAFCKEYTGDPQECVDIGGDYTDDGTQVCIGYTIGESQCCIGEWVSNDNKFFGSNTQDKFMCYPQSDSLGINQNLFAECCGAVEGGDCFNKENPLNNFGGNGLLYRYEGVPLYVAVFADKPLIGDPDGSGRYVTEITTGKTFLANEPLLNNKLSITNWTSFNKLEFTLYSNYNNNPSTLVITDSNGKTSLVSVFDNIVTNRAPEKLNIVSINISDIITNAEENFDISKINSLEFVALAGVGGSRAAIDNIVLKKPSEGNYYCSGPWKEWITDLDGVNGAVGFNEQNPDTVDFIELSKAQYVCESDFFSDWTGNVCCGDDSRSEYGEYYKDNSSGQICWGGTILKEGLLLSEVTGHDNLKNNSVLFYNGKVEVCDIALDEFNSIKVSYNGTYDANAGNLLTQDNAHYNAPFSIKGGYTCMSGDGWVPVGDIGKTKLLGAKLLNLTIGKEYSLFCGKEDIVFNKELALDQIPLIHSACVLKINEYHEEGELEGDVVLGIAIRESETVQTFIDSILRNYEQFGVLKNSEDPTEGYTIEYNCNDITEDTNETAFFTQCEETGTADFKLYYNKQYNLLLISEARLTGPDYDNDGFVGFIVDAWNRFILFFANLFGSADKDKIYLANNDALAFAHENVDEFYVANMSGKFVKGSSQETNDKDYIRIEYTGFNKDSILLLQNSFETKYSDINGLKITGTAQDPTKNDGELLYVFVEGDVSTDARPWDWKTLTSIIRPRPIPSDK